VREAACVDGIETSEICSQLLRNSALSGCRAISELRSQSGSRSDVDAERCRCFRDQVEEIVCDAVEYCESVFVSTRGWRRRVLRRAR
jgi:hypothetical protein